MAAPRPFGTGYYGQGYYSRYRGEVYTVGGGTEIRFSAQADGTRVRGALGQADLQFASWTWGVYHIRHLAAASGISWTVFSHGGNRVVNPQARTQIIFDAWAEHFDRSWLLPPPCAPGAWPEAEPCLDGAWAAPGKAPQGVWPVTAPCEAGSWDTPPAGAPGAWKPVRLPA